MNRILIKNSFSTFLGLFIAVDLVLGQQAFLDSLVKKLRAADKEDTSTVIALSSIATYYAFAQFDSCLYYARQAKDLSEKINYPTGRIFSYRNIFSALNNQANYPRALEAALNLQKITEEIKKGDPSARASASYLLGVVYREMADYPDAIFELNQSINFQKESGKSMSESFPAHSQLGIVYMLENKLDSALTYAQQGYELGSHAKEFKKFYSLALGALGNVHEALHNYQSAEEFYRLGIVQSQLVNNVYFLARNYNNLAGLYAKTDRKDSCIYYAGIALSICKQHNFGEFAFDASRILTDIYGRGANADSTLKYMKIMVAAKDTVFSQAKGQQFQEFAYKEVQRLQKINIDKERSLNLVKLYILLAALVVLLLLAFILYRNNRQKQKAKNKIEKAYAELKSTQSQLIQSEKMASLGELTAGIAHEIQNPLNFVNNFSEVNKELIAELNNEIDLGNFSQAKSIAKDIEANEEKIINHGKRADVIVKGMLQHSRISTGQKEPTDINALADEYLRLAYHGLRAKDSSFNATMNTDFDDSIDKINIIPQDFGRVLLNLYNNAFYAVSQKKKTAGDGYDPSVSVSTNKINDKVEISVKDNGNGIPQKVVDKIFQPFFTTKPTGQGTGLGLSMSYDIVKAQGGEINVLTKEGEGSEFIMQLPLNTAS
ncbi:MAG TPA: ATP-binding protein [Puia sp.]|nr:ATP-binding protein [Puia sp.]